MTSIQIVEIVGSFAEDKDKAREIRVNVLIPALEKKDEVTLDFSGVDSATQSFIHALISDLFRKFGNDVLDRIAFKNCSDDVKKIINIVVSYMQEGDE